MKKNTGNKQLLDPEKCGQLMASKLTNDCLEEAIRYLGEVLSAIGNVGHIRCFLYNRIEDTYIGLIEVSIDGTEILSSHASPFMFSTSVPRGMRVKKNAVAVNLHEVASVNYLNTVKMADYSYVIRQSLFSTNEYDCYIGITTNDAIFCNNEVNNWIEQATKPFVNTLTQITNFQAYFSGELEHKTHINKLRICPGLRGVITQIEKVAKTKITVLIEGETGVGKEYVAKSIHEFSNVKLGPFISVNCGAIPEHLIDSILFGHEKGSFTGAYERKIGYFEQAHNGTLFLDEIGELPLQSQVRLLRVLQERTIQRIGSTQGIPLNLRVIVATHRNLQEKVLLGEFREDLFYRLNAYTIHVPPLRERVTDIYGLCNSFIKEKTKEYNFENIPTLPQKEQEKLFAYPWNGNVRELENVIDRAFINNIGQHENLLLQIILPKTTENQQRESTLLEPYIAGKKTLEDFTNAYIMYVMELTDGKIYGKNGAAKYLGLHPNTLRSRLEKMKWKASSKKNAEEKI